MKDTQITYGVTIYAVGTSVWNAVETLGQAKQWGPLVGLKTTNLPTGADFDWECKFLANGVSMKAAGRYVNGGVVLTWWK